MNRDYVVIFWSFSATPSRTKKYHKHSAAMPADARPITIDHTADRLVASVGRSGRC
jgi:hypothetical protein